MLSKEINKIILIDINKITLLLLPYETAKNNKKRQIYKSTI